MKRSGKNRSYANSRRSDANDREGSYKRRRAPAPVVVSANPTLSLMTESSSVNIGLLIGDGGDDESGDETYRLPDSFIKGTVSLSPIVDRAQVIEAQSSLSSSPATSSSPSHPIVNARPMLSEATIQILNHAEDVEQALAWLASAGKPWSVTENSLLFPERESSSIESKMTSYWRQFAATVKGIVQSKQMISDIEMGNIVDQVYRELICRSNQMDQIQPPCWAVVGPSGVGKRSLLESLFSTPISAKSGNGLAAVVWDISSIGTFTVESIKKSLTDLVMSSAFVEEACLLRRRRTFGGQAATAKSFHLWRPIIIKDLDHLMDMKHFSTQDKNDLCAFIVELFTVVVPRLVPAPLRDSEEDFVSPPIAEHRTRPLVVVVVESRHSFQTRDWLRQCFSGAHVSINTKSSRTDVVRNAPPTSLTSSRFVGSEASSSKVVYLGGKLSCARMRSWLKTLRCRLTDAQWRMRFKLCNMPRLALVTSLSLEHFFVSCVSRSIGAPCPMGTWQRQVDFCLIPFDHARPLEHVQGGVHVSRNGTDDGVPLDYKVDLDDIVIQDDARSVAVEHAWARALSSSTFGHVMEQVGLRMERVIAALESSPRTPPAVPRMPVVELSRFFALRANFIDQIDLFGREDELKPYLERALSSFITTLGKESHHVTSRQASLEGEKCPVSGYWTRAQVLKAVGVSTSSAIAGVQFTKLEDGDKWFPQKPR